MSPHSISAGSPYSLIDHLSLPIIYAPSDFPCLTAHERGSRKQNVLG